MDKKNELVARLKEEGLVPDTKRPGEFIPGKNGKNGARNGDNLKFLDPNNWVFHDQVVERVLDGDYLGIMPYSGEFVTTMNCSNRCKIPCSYQVPKEIEGVWARNDFKNPIAHMQSLEFATEMMDKLIDGGLKGLIFTGGGEPFLFPKLEDLMLHATSRGIDIVSYTNGNAVSEARLEKMVAAKPLLVRLSLNAGTQDVYNEFHDPVGKNGAFKNALRSIECLAKASALNSTMTFGVAVVINEINRNDLVEAANRVREIAERTGGGISFVTYRPAYNYYGSDQLTKNLLDETHAIVETDVRKALNGTGIKVSNISSRYEALKVNTRHYDRCLASGLYVELSPSGKLHVCCDRNCHRDYTIGDLSQSTLKDIWKGAERKRMLDYIDATECSICPPACKPHLTNMQFNQIEWLREAGEMHKVEAWIEEQRKAPRPKMVNF